MKEILLRVDEELRTADSSGLDPVPDFGAWCGIEVVRTKDIPKPLVQTFEVTVTTPANDMGPAEADDVAVGIRNWLASTRTIGVKETTNA